MKIMVFVEGTILKPSKDEKDFSSYVPTEEAVEKLKAWDKKAEILYLTSRKKDDIDDVNMLLDRHGFPHGKIFFRHIDYEKVENYIDIIEQEKPDIYIDDTIESVDIFRVVEPRIEKDSIKIITIHEFSGLSNLPDDPNELKKSQSVIETYEIPQGRMFIVKSDDKMSAGFLELNINTELKKHSRPVEEFLKQAKGSSLIKMDDKEELLSTDEEIKIPANKEHVHSNYTDETSLTFWMFKGDITEIINEIRKDYNRI